MTASLLMHRWRLNELMARYRIGTNELAEQMGYLPQSVSKLRGKDSMPRLDGDALANLCDSINRVIKKKGGTDVVSPTDLIEYSFEDR